MQSGGGTSRKVGLRKYAHHDSSECLAGDPSHANGIPSESAIFIDKRTTIHGGSCEMHSERIRRDNCTIMAKQED